MNKNYFVDKNLAIKLNELGYKETCGAIYRTNGNGKVFDLFVGGCKYTYDYDVLQHKDILAPTLQEVQTWLRDNYDIDVLPKIRQEKDYCCYIYKHSKAVCCKVGYGNDFYECLRDGIVEGLKYID